MNKKSNEELIVDFVIEATKRVGYEAFKGCETQVISDALHINRTNVSAILNQLCSEDKFEKKPGKPVLYRMTYEFWNQNNYRKTVNSEFDSIIGNEESLSKSIYQAKAAILYPPMGLNTLILGETGVGKTMFAEIMYRFMIENRRIHEDAPFVSFNCADYANNPQLLLAQLFGAVKGSYTGADQDRIGLVTKADGGILFLDEVHRLPPEGQEMFFYLLDKGAYKPLGSTGDFKRAHLLIICATTESKDSSLLETFTRRIPMVIYLPNLQERSLKERFELISDFFSQESSRISREITVTTEVVKSLMLYNCRGNIGQLKNDIQLACANGFLKCMVNEENKVYVDLDELPDYVKKGIVNYRPHINEIKTLISENSIYTFSNERQSNVLVEAQDQDLFIFYDTLEDRISTLKARGLSQSDISLIMSMEIDQYFKKYIYKINEDTNKEELSKVVDKKIIALVESFLAYAGKELNRVFPQRIFYGLCLHVGASLERIRLSKTIENHKIDEIIEQHFNEFRVANFLADTLEREFELRISKDEIGFIAMFITDEFIHQQSQIEKVIVLIAMHGNSTASSMTDVVNKLVGEQNTFAFDMPLEKPAEWGLETLKEKVMTINRGGGVLLLADMGSLSMFGEVISQETGVVVKCIDMVTTLIALEASRKAALGICIEDIYNEIIHKNLFNVNYSHELYGKLDSSKQNIIITMCMTGEGSAIKLKNLVEEQLYIGDKNIQVIPMAISDREELMLKLKLITKDKKILAIVGTLNPNLHGIPFISASALFLDRNFTHLRNIVNFDLEPIDISEIRVICSKIINSFKDDIVAYDLNILEPLLISWFENIQKVLNILLDKESIVGVSMHLACVIEKLIQNQPMAVFLEKEAYFQQHEMSLKLLKSELKPIENVFNIDIREDELCHIYASLVKN